ncbi:hypothetical protein Cgig2_026776 [Carnegiea gigantea]|uniref:Transcription factor SRM1 n=1 Tax=Carnegiea gigantea TaxID=171969 RepID=A0A9Q1GQP6_9CARY|nr:hypothetical protein Cgig2_026776 [Carnegiea gigantea]
MAVDEKDDSCSWSRGQDKAFENALATYPEDLEDRWEKIAADVPGKTLEEVKHHYELLVEDINQIESGRIPLPSYSPLSEGSSGNAADDSNGKKGQSGNGGSESNHGGKASRSEQERRKGIAWTEEEHRQSKPAVLNAKLKTEKSDARSALGWFHAEFALISLIRNWGNHMLFLLGLDKYGKGDWRSISRNFVVTRTPTQVASHAQKYFIRLNSMNKDRRRSSIHDITSVNSGDLSSLPGPITGQTNTTAVPASGAASAKSNKQAAAQVPSGGPAGVGVYGTPTIGQPVGGPLVSAVGTPVNLSAPPHMAYGVRAPVSGAVVPGAPMGMAPMTYPMPHTPAHRGCLVLKLFRMISLAQSSISDAHLSLSSLLLVYDAAFFGMQD